MGIYPSGHAPPLPGFDIKMAVRNKGGRAYSPAQSQASSESELILKAQEQYLTTILERTETNTLETLERIRRVEAGATGPPPVHARVRVVNNKNVSDNSEMESDSEYSVMTDIQDYYGDKLQLATTEQTNVTVDVKEARMMEDRRKKSSKQGGQIRTRGVDNEAYLEDSQSMHTRNLVSNQQQMHQRRSDSIHQEQHMSTSAYSSSAMEKGYTTTQDLITPVILERATAHMPSVGQVKNNFDVLIRILDNNAPYTSAHDEDDISSVLTEEERYRLREVIMQDEKIQTFLKESYTTEKMLMLKDHRKIEEVIKPQKWDVLIRIIDDKADAAMSAGTRSESKSSEHKSSLTAHELRSMSEVMVDWSHVQRQDQEARSGYSGVSSTIARSTADRSGTEMVATDYVINREAYFASGETSYETYQK